MTTLEDIIARLVRVVRPVVETHTHWHFSHSQASVLQELDTILTDLESLAVSHNAPQDQTVETPSV